MLEVIDRYALGPEVDDVSAVIVVRRVSIADTPWLRVDTCTGQFYRISRCPVSKPENLLDLSRSWLDVEWDLKTAARSCTVVGGCKCG